MHPVFTLQPHSYFYPRPPRGGRRWATPNACLLTLFLSTPSARRATYIGEGGSTPPRYFYPRPPRGGRRFPRCCHGHWAYFYPRPPRGGRLCVFASLTACASISIHALREEGDPKRERNSTAKEDPFLSTPSARRATFYEGLFHTAERHFYPRPPRGGRLIFAAVKAALNYFYPRPPRGGRHCRPLLSGSF